MRCGVRALLAAVIAFVLPSLPTNAALAAVQKVAFVPLDNRPVTLQLPRMLGAIAGVSVIVPPAASLGHYLEPGKPDAILAWLASNETADAGAFVTSLDMLVYGGLVASRVPGESAAAGYLRLRQLAELRARRPGAYFATFGTLMRLAPTGVPNAPQTASYWATGETVNLIAQYAALPSPPQTPEQRAFAARLRERIGDATLDEYLGARSRNRAVDEFALQIAAEGEFDRIVIGQDDAGPTGLHLADIAALERARHAFGLDRRASIEPGADELGMVLLAQALAHGIGWRPTVRVRYSRSNGGAVVDPLEYVPIDATISRLIAACGAQRVEDAGADIDLFVRVAGTSDADERDFVSAIVADAGAGKSATVGDLTFLAGQAPSEEQQALVDALLAQKVAAKIDGFASWNTDANTMGTALAVAIAAGVGRRTRRYDARAHAEFMLNRYADDYAFHQFVRPVLNADLRKRDIDPTLLFAPVAGETDERNRALLWPLALDLLEKGFPDYTDAGLTITLPWQRTFETQLDIRLKKR